MVKSILIRLSMNAIILPEARGFSIVTAYAGTAPTKLVKIITKKSIIRSMTADYSTGKETPQGSPQGLQ